MYIVHFMWNVYNIRYINISYICSNVLSFRNQNHLDNSFSSSPKCKISFICNGDVPTKTGLCPAQPAEQQAASVRSRLAEQHRVDVASKAGQWRDIHWFWFYMIKFKLTVFCRVWFTCRTTFEAGLCTYLTGPHWKQIPISPKLQICQTDPTHNLCSAVAVFSAPEEGSGST